MQFGALTVNLGASLPIFIIFIRKNEQLLYITGDSIFEIKCSYSLFEECVEIARVAEQKF